MSSSRNSRLSVISPLEAHKQAGESPAYPDLID